MKVFWNTKGKRTASFLMAFFLIIGTTPVQFTVSAEENDTEVATNNTEGGKEMEALSSIQEHTISADITGKGNLIFRKAGTEEGTLTVESDPKTIVTEFYEGTDYTITATPEEHYIVTKFNINDIDAMRMDTDSDEKSITYTFADGIQEDYTTAVEFSLEEYNLNTDISGMGTLKFVPLETSELETIIVSDETAEEEKTDKISYSEYTVHIEPDTGYEMESITINSVDRTEDVNEGSIALGEIEEELTVSVQFSQKKYKMEATVLEGGSIRVSSTNEGCSSIEIEGNASGLMKEDNLIYDNAYILSIASKEGWHISNVLLNGESQELSSEKNQPKTKEIDLKEALGQVVDGEVDKLSVKVEFLKDTFTLACTITGDGEIIWPETPEAIPIPDSNSVEVEYSAEDYCITAKLKEDYENYRITKFVIDEGTEKENVVYDVTDIDFTTEEAIDQLSTYNDKHVAEYIFEDGITKEHTLSLVVERDLHKLSGEITGKGQIQFVPAEDNTDISVKSASISKQDVDDTNITDTAVNQTAVISHYDKYQVKIIAQKNYHIESIILDGNSINLQEDKPAEHIITEQNITADTEIEVVFERNRYTLTAKQNTDASYGMKFSPLEEGVGEEITIENVEQEYTQSFIYSSGYSLVIEQKENMDNLHIAGIKVNGIEIENPSTEQNPSKMEVELNKETLGLTDIAELTDIVVEILYITNSYEVSVKVIDRLTQVKLEDEVMGQVTLMNNEETSVAVNASLENPTKVLVNYTDTYTIDVMTTAEKYRIAKIYMIVEEQETVLYDNVNKNNDENEKNAFTINGGIKQNTYIAVEFEIDTYEIDVIASEGGVVSTSLDKTLNAVEHGQDCIVAFSPSNGYQVAEFKTIGTEEKVVEAINCSEEEQRKYNYTLTSITEDKTIKINFTEIETDTSFDTLSEAGINVSSDGDNILVTEGNSYYTDAKGTEYIAQYNLSLKESGDDTKYQVIACYNGRNQYAETFDIVEDANTSTIETTTFQIRDANKFGTEKIIKLSTPVKFVFDSDVPEIRLIMHENNITDVISEKKHTVWKNGECEEFTLSGMSKDSNVKYILCADAPLTYEEQNGEETEKTVYMVQPDAQGNFIFNNVKLVADNMTFYLYVVDWTKKSVEAQVDVYKDGSAPIVTDMKLVENVTIRNFINANNSDVTLQISANDQTKLAEGKDVNASGIRKVEVFADGVALPVEDTKLQDSGMITTAGETKNYTVSIPLEGSKAFAYARKLTVKLTDRLGNVSKEYMLTSFANGYESSNLILEKEAPVLSMEQNMKNAYVEKTGEEKKYWFNYIPEFNYAVSDKQEKNGSGLGVRKVYLNDTELSLYSKNYEQDVQDETGTILPETLSAMSDGKNTVKVAFIDQAGNSTEMSKEIYLDTHIPEITEIKIERKNNEIIQKILNFLTFGNFFNNEVNVTVSVEDAKNTVGDTIPSSGIKSVKLYFGGEEYKTISKIKKNGTVTFTLPEDSLSQKQKLYLDEIVTVEVLDNAGNTTGQKEMTTANSNLSSSGLMIETVNPTISIQEDRVDYKTDEGKWFNDGNTKYTVSVADKDSGLRSVEIKINDTIVVNKSYNQKESVVKEKVYEISNKSADKPEDGGYTVTVTVVDNAGNEYSKQTDRVYEDKIAPSVISFVFEADGEQEMDGKTLYYQETDYGYYFLEDTKVTIYAEDGSNPNDSGVKEIRYYTIDENQKKSEIKEVKADKAGKISFTIPAEFKGQIYACAYDYLENHDKDFVNPGSMIIESPEQHSKEEHITLTKLETLFEDSNGGELYADDVNIDVIITDTYSGIRSVEWEVAAPYDKENNYSGKVELDNSGKIMQESDADNWKLTQTEKNIVTEMKNTFVVSNNSNDIEITIKMTDRAGNTSEQELMFSIDKTLPVITIEYDNMDADQENDKIFKESRIATITVEERNFDPENFICDITNTDNTIPVIAEWSTSTNNENPDESINVTTIAFVEDGDYTLEVSGMDNAENKAEPLPIDEFTIDRTLPIITVTYDNESAVNNNYFANERTATIQIEEHNFDTSRIEISGTATNDGTGIQFPATARWNSAGDVHTATISCGQDGLYRFDVAYMDMAGNEAEPFTGEEFYIDMTAPEIEITGVENASANNGEVVPVITLTDTNYDVNGVSIELIGANRGAVTPDGAYTTHAYGQAFTFADFKNEQSNDDLYTLTATLTDMAGNESTESITFSVNRFGSVYVLEDSLKDIAGTYIQNEIDVKLTEVNVDSLEHDKIKVVVDTNGTPVDLVEGKDYTVHQSGGNGSWYQYDYTIHKALFAGDGRYIVTLYSEDVAGNVNENIDETKKAEISFGIDKTSPMVTPIDIESNEQYPVDVKNATVTVNDNLVLEQVDVYIGDKKCEYAIEGESYTFQIPSATSRQDVTIAAVDAAGNRTNYIINGVLVTTNAFIRWYNNKPLFVGTIVGVVVLSGGVTGVSIFFRRRKRM